MGIRVLHVEYNEDIRDMVSVMLCGEGFDVRSVSSSLYIEEALVTIEPDVLLVDPETPGMTLEELADFLRRPGVAPAVLFSTLPDHVLSSFSEKAGGLSFLEKPACMSRLAATLKEMLRPDEGVHAAR